MLTSDNTLIDLNKHTLISHALIRMQQRGIKSKDIALVLRYGRVIYSRGLIFRVVGRKEVERYLSKGLNLTRVEGVHVLVHTNGTVITTYRNHNLRPIRPTKRKQAFHH